MYLFLKVSSLVCSAMIFIIVYSEDVRGIDVEQQLNLHPIKAVPEYCRLWSVDSVVSDELTKISNDLCQRS